MFYFKNVLCLLKHSHGSRLLTIDGSLDHLEVIKRMKKLYDNFEVNSIVEETVTEEEKTEEFEFIDSLLGTAVMK
jgi:Endoribonuclease XendoU